MARRISEVSVQGHLGSWAGERGRDLSIERDIKARKKSEDISRTSTGILSSVVESNVFHGFITMIVFFTCLALGLERDWPHWPGWELLETIFVAIFAAEFCVKFAHMRCVYFKDLYNWLDFVLALFGVADVVIIGWLYSPGSGNLRVLSVLRIVRLLRVGRVLRLMKGTEQLIMVVQGLIDSVKCTFWVMVVWMLVVYTSSILIMTFFDKDQAANFPGYTVEEHRIKEMEILQEFNPEVYFGSMWKTCVTLFSMAFMATWPEVIVPMLVVWPAFICVFILFFLIMFGLLNVVVALIVDKVLGNARRMEDELRLAAHVRRMCILDRIRQLVSSLDDDGDGHITLRELQSHLTNEDTELYNLCYNSELQLPVGCTASELMLLLDTNGDGDVQLDEFVQSFFRLVESSYEQRVGMLLMGINGVKTSLLRSVHKLEHRFDKIERLMERQATRKPDSTKGTLMFAGAGSDGIGRLTVDLSAVESYVQQALQDLHQAASSTQEQVSANLSHSEPCCGAQASLRPVSSGTEDGYMAQGKDTLDFRSYLLASSVASPSGLITQEVVSQAHSALLPTTGLVNKDRRVRRHLETELEA